MGREVRRVPKDWIHPRTPAGSLKPLYDGCVLKSAAEDREEGEAPPDPADYMPEWSDEEADHLMMYEDTTEGTPISPAFKTAEELARWLADTKASAFADIPASYEAWLATIRAGSAPSAVTTGGRMYSGVEAMLELGKGK